jgi:hypothetical protein
MAYAYEIDVERQLVVVVFSADANLAEAEAVMTQVHADPRHSLRFSRVYDCRAVTRLPPLGELRAVAELFRRRIDPTVDARRAIVARGGAPYGLGRMLQALLDLVGVDLHVFTDLDEAIAWATGQVESGSGPGRSGGALDSGVGRDR